LLARNKSATPPITRIYDRTSLALHRHDAHLGSAGWLAAFARTVTAGHAILIDFVVGTPDEHTHRHRAIDLVSNETDYAGATLDAAIVT
jgi:hypothetical protein